MTTRSFELIDGKSDKFWTITLDREQYTVQFGRRGTAGQTQTKGIGSLDGAREAFDKLVAEKLKKGYKEVGTGLNGSGVADARSPAPAPGVDEGALSATPPKPAASPPPEGPEAPMAAPEPAATPLAGDAARA